MWHLTDNKQSTGVAASQQKNLCLVCLLLKIDITSVIDVNKNKYIISCFLIRSSTLIHVLPLLNYNQCQCHYASSVSADNCLKIPRSTCLSFAQHSLFLFKQQPFNGLFSRTTWVSRYQKGKTNLDFTGARDSEWQWHQLGHMQACTSLQTDNHANTPPLVFYRPDALPAAQPTASKHWRHCFLFKT